MSLPTSATFVPASKFLVPDYKGSISFAVNGTYSTAIFENDVWAFTNLTLSGAQPIENFGISTQNSNVIISSYTSSYNTEDQVSRLRYTVEGRGEQIINFGQGTVGTLEWSISFNNHSVDKGKGWTTFNDGTIVLTGATGNVSIVRYDYFGYGLPSSNLQRFLQLHSVAIVTAATLAVTVTIAVVIKVKKQRKFE